MKPTITVLSRDEVLLIHEASLEVLEKTGIDMASEEVAEFLAKKGAIRDGSRIRFPKKMIEDCIGKINHSVLLASRDGEHDITIPFNDTTFNSTSGYSPYIYDESNTEKRQSTAEDLAKAACLCDALDEVDFFWPIFMPTEESAPEMEEINALYTSFKHISKHIQCSCSSRAAAIWQVKLARVIAGGDENLRRRPVFSAVASPTTPLAFEKGTSEALAVFAEAGVPVAPMNVVLAGTTAPGTFAGTLVVTNAEQLAALAILKSYNPEAPMIYAVDTGSADMRTGDVAYENPDYDIFSFACGQLARFYDIPCVAGSGSSEERNFKEESGFNKNVLRTAINQMAITDTANWIGSRDDCLSSSFWDIVLDAEVCKYAKLYCKERHVDKNTLAVDVIDEVGPRGEFISHKHTYNNFKKEINLINICDSFIFKNQNVDFIRSATQKAQEIIKNHKTAPIEEAVSEKLDGLMAEARKVFYG